MDTIQDKFRQARRRFEELRDAFRDQPAPNLSRETLDAMQETMRLAEEIERRYPELLRATTRGC